VASSFRFDLNLTTQFSAALFLVFPNDEMGEIYIFKLAHDYLTGFSGKDHSEYSREKMYT
jgi:hypothetical protein